MCCVRPTASSIVLGCVLSLLATLPTQRAWARPQATANTTTQTKAQSSVDKPTDNTGDNPVDEQAELVEKSAVEKFLAVLVKRPTTGTALERVFGYHVQRGSLAGLIEQLTEKAKSGQATEEAGRYWMLVGLLQLQRGEDAQAVSALSQAQTILKDNAMAAFHHGQARMLVGDTESAATAFELAIARKPSRPDYLNVARELGRLYQREGRVEDALRIWNELEKTFPGDDSVRQRIAATLVEEGDLAGALVRFEKLATAAKNENDKIAFALDAADLRSQLGQKAKATQDLDTLLTKLRPGSYLYEEARRRVEKIFLSSGDYAGLTEYYQRWVAAHPDDLNAMLRLARTLSMQGRSAEAIQRFEQAIERAPTDAGARLALIDAYQADLRYADAAKQFEALVAAHPNNPDYLVRYGQALMNDTKVPEADRRQAAANVWRRLTAARPKDAAVHSQVADLMRGAQLTDEAIAGYRAAIDLAPDEPQHKEYLGEYLHQLKRTDEALVVWRSLAAGNARTRDNLVRLAEVLKQFEQPDEALKTLEAACELKPKVTERLRFVEWLSEVRQFDKANAQLTLARQEAENVEDRERVFATSVKIYQEAGTLEDKIKELAAATEAAPADSEKWRQLAVMYGANRQLQEAMTAIERAVKAAPKSIETLDVAARMAEEAGRLPEAIDMRRQLVDIDRRFRSAHLQRLATLYVSTGQNDQALATGKEMLAGAGGAIETFKFYADLCGQLGREDERLDTLRRCVRLNPRSSEALELLANQLSDEFKTDQAIELTWKILDAAKEIEERRRTVTKLTDLYLRNNRLDQLISRLEFRGRESGDRRTAIDLVATAYQQAGDLGLARETLEGLLRESGRDTLLMERLVGLAELAGEMDRAVELQRELMSLAPSKPAQSKLAMLLMDIGAFEEAQSLWLSAIDPRNAPEQMARHIDRLFAAGESQAATELTNKLIEANPSDWEMLTRRMVLLAEAGNWTAAAKDATALLAMKLPDDTESESTKKAKASMKNSPYAAQMAAQASYLAQYPPKLRHVQNLYSFYQLVDERYGSQQPRALPTVESVGHAKAIGQYVLYRDASVQDGGQLDKILASLKQQAMAATAKADDVLDWYVAQQLTESIRQEAGEDLRNPESWGSLWRLVEVDPKAGELLLGQQFANRRQYAGRTDFQIRPLADTRLTWLKQRAATATNETTSFNPYAGLMDWQTIYVSELKIAGKLEEAEQYSKTVKKKSNVPPNANLIVRLQFLAQSDEDDDALWSALEGIIDSKDRSLQQMLGAGTPVSYALQIFLNPDRVREKRSLGPTDATYRQRVMQLLDLAAKQLAEKRPSRNQLRLSGMGAPRRTYINVGNNYQSISIDFPPTGLGPDDDYIQALYSANQQMKEHVPAWIDRLRETAPQAEPRLSVQRWLQCAILLQWQGDNAAASRELQKAIDIAAKEVVHEEASLRMLQADLLLRQDRQQDALAVIEQLAVYDQSAMAVREFAAARLAAKLGDQERARRAARRLFGVRLDTDTQIELAKLLRAVDMPELAADLVRRMRGRSGSSTQQLQSLMTYFTSQNDKDQASAVAIELLQRSAPTRKTTNNYRTTDQMMRTEAMQTLANNGRLSALVADTEKRLSRAPKSQRLRAELAEMYSVSGQNEKLQAMLGQTEENAAESTTALETSAKQLMAAGKFKEACDVYLKVLRRKPQLFGNQYYEIRQPFQQARRSGELVDLILEVGIRKFESQRIGELCGDLVRDEQNAEKARTLLMAYLELPHARQNGMYSLHSAMGNARVLLTDRAVVEKLVDYLIRASKVEGASWETLFQGYSTSSDGRHNNTITYLVRFIADKPEYVELIETRLREELKKRPEWSEGKAWLGLVLASTRRYDEAIELLKHLADKEAKPPVTYDALWLIGSLIDAHKPMQPLAAQMYEVALQSPTNRSNRQFQYSLEGRACNLMVETGNKPRARELALAEVQRRKEATGTNQFGNDEYEAYEKINQTISLIEFLNKVDAQADAVKLGREFDRSNFAKAANFSRGSEAQFDSLMKKLVAELRKQGGIAFLESMIDAQTKGPFAVDLGISVDERPFTSGGLKSLWVDMLEEVAGRPDQAQALKKLASDLQTLAEKRAQDPSVRTALAITSRLTGANEPLDQLIKQIRAGQILRTQPVDPPKADRDTNTKPTPAGNSPAGKSAANNSVGKSDAVTIADAHLASIASLFWQRQAERSTPDAATNQLESLVEWIDQHVATWPGPARIHLLASLGHQFIARQDKASASAMWSKCIPQPDSTQSSIAQSGITQWMLVDLAMAATMADLQDLSFQALAAFSKASTGAPEVAGQQPTNSLGQLLGNLTQPNRVRSSRPNIESDSSQEQLAQRVIELDNLWTTKKIPSEKLIEPLVALVTRQPGQLDPLVIKSRVNSNRGLDVDSVFDRLAKRAAQCQQTDLLLSRLAPKSASPAKSNPAANPNASKPNAATNLDTGSHQALVGRLMTALAHLRAGQGKPASEIIVSLDKTTLGAAPRDFLVQTLLVALENAESRPGAVDLSLSFIDQNRPAERYAEVSPFDSLALQVAKQTVNHNLPRESQNAAIKAYLDLCRHNNARYSGTSGIQISVGQFEEIARMLLSHGSTADSLKYLAERQAAYNLGMDRENDWVGSWALEALNGNKNPAETYKILADWTFEGDGALRSIVAFAHRAPLPDWIPVEVGGAYPNFAPTVDPQMPLVSSFYFMAKLAEQTNQVSDLIDRYTAARAQGRAGATVGWAIALATQKQKVPDELLAEIDKRWPTIAPAENNQPKSMAPLAELQLAVLLADDPERAMWAKATAQQVAEHGHKAGRTYIAPWVARFQHQRGWSASTGLMPATQLKHWQASNSGNAKDFYEGKTATTWLTDGQHSIEHLCGFATDWLWLRYPLTGNFQFEVETQDGGYRESELYVGGLRFSYSGSNGYVDVQSEDGRDWIRKKTQAIKKGEWNKHQVTLDDQYLSYSINGSAIYREARQPGPVWIALRSLGVRQTTARHITISGQPKLARSVGLLDSQNMRGWSGYYYSLPLPSSGLDKASAESNGEDGSFSRTGPALDDLQNLTWTVQDKELISGGSASGGPGQQCMLQFSKPLSSGDKLEYEFFYAPGAYEVHPCLGRTAFLLRPDGLRKHWTTEPFTSWKTPTDNEVKVDGQTALPLRADDWNKIALETTADRIKIQLNGQLILDQAWDYAIPNATFGLFHYQDKSKVRVRNIQLSGTWPETLPEKLLE